MGTAHRSTLSTPLALAGGLAGGRSVSSDGARAKRLSNYKSASYVAFKTTVAHWFAEARELFGASQRDVAGITGTSRALVEQWEKPDGDNSIRVDVALAAVKDAADKARNEVDTLSRIRCAAVAKTMARVLEDAASMAREISHSIET